MVVLLFRSKGQKLKVTRFINIMDGYLNGYSAELWDIGLRLPLHDRCVCVRRCKTLKRARFLTLRLQRMHHCNPCPSQPASFPPRTTGEAIARILHIT